MSITIENGDIQKHANAVINYTIEQIDCVCDVLTQSQDYDTLAKFLWSLPNNDVVNNSECVLKAKAHVVFKQAFIINVIYIHSFTIYVSYHFVGYAQDKKHLV